MEIKMNIFIKEACVENLNQAIAAEKKGANRIELCSHLETGGLTPSKDLITEVRKHLTIPIRVMIRPRAGNFVYSKTEISEMLASIDFCKKAEIEGVVFGVLKQDFTLDIKAITKITFHAAPLKVVIHKAIDESKDSLAAVAELLKIKGINTLLTSGGAATAFRGKEILKEMQEICGKQIELMPAGRITDLNLEELHQYLGAKAYHGRKIVGDLQ